MRALVCASIVTVILLCSVRAAPETNLTPATARKLRVIGSIYKEANAAPEDSDQRFELYREFIASSNDLVKELPNNFEIWFLRANIALETNDPKIGWDAGKNLLRLGAESSPEPPTRQLLDALERRGWLSENAPAFSKGDVLSLEKINQTMTEAAKSDFETRLDLLDQVFENCSAMLLRDSSNSELLRLRAWVSMELLRPKNAWEDGQKLKAIAASNLRDPKIEKILTELQNKGWLENNPPALGPTPGTSWTNSLHMKFAPVPGSSILVSHLGNPGQGLFQVF